LSNVAAMKPFNDYIAEAIFPVVASKKQSGKIYGIDAADNIHRRHATLRPAGAEPNRVSQTADATRSYTCNDHALADSVTVEEEQQAEAEAQPAIDCVTNLVERLRLDQELAALAAVASFTAGTAPSTTWDDPNSDPIGDIKTNILELRDAGQVIPNAMAFDYEVYMHLINHPDIQARVTSVLTPEATTGSFEAGKRLLATVFGLSEVNVARISRYVTSEINDTTPTFANIWGVGAYLYYKEPAKIRTANAGLTVVWNVPPAAANPRLGGGIVDGFAVYMQDGGFRKATEYMVSRYYDLEVLNPTSGLKVANVIA
jgi:hypothetical protein